jgi:hypothetical protein
MTARRADLERIGLRYGCGARRASHQLTAQEDTMNKEMFDKGLAIRKSVIGAEFVDKALRRPTTSTCRSRSS